MISKLLTNSIDQTASYWALRMADHSCSRKDKKAFENWLAESELHDVAYRKQLATLELLQGLSEEPKLKSLREQVLQETAVQKSSWFPHAIAYAMVLAAFVFFGRDTFYNYLPFNVEEHPSHSATEYLSAVGERKRVSLRDGSVVTLNTDTKISVYYQPKKRFIVLDKGQALFDVAKNPLRPFIVSAGGQAVTALGTSFDVHLQLDKAVKVVLIEGKVSVDSMGQSGGMHEKTASGRHVTMVAGQQLLIGESTQDSRLEAADINSATSWLQGRLVFHDQPLISVVKNINRYNIKKINLDKTKSWSDIRISGVFNTQKNLDFIRAISSRHDLVLDIQNDMIRVTRKAETNK